VAPRAARSADRPTLGRTDLRAGRRPDRAVDERCPPSLPRRAGCPAGKVSRAMSEPMPDTGLSPLEETLSRLVPLPSGLSRERLLFEAGRAAARPGRRWPVLAAASSLFAFVLGLQLLTRPAPSLSARTAI